MRKLMAMFLAVLFGIFMLAGCDGGRMARSLSAAPEPTQPPAPVQSAVPSILTVTFSNSTEYVFNEIYISPTAANDWGEELLGSTRVLKSNGSIEVDIPAYQYDNYDIRVMDEDRDVYEFTYVPLKDGGEIAIAFEDAGLAANVSDKNGAAVASVTGALNGEITGGNSGGGTEAQTASGTGYDTNGQFSFTVYNESGYDIYAIHMGPASASSDDDIDMLPRILYADESIELSGTVADVQRAETEWTLHITDVVGDVSASFDIFNPWTISYVDITWNGDSNGYVCEFFY